MTAPWATLQLIFFIPILLHHYFIILPSSIVSVFFPENLHSYRRLTSESVFWFLLFIFFSSPQKQSPCISSFLLHFFQLPPKNNPSHFFVPSSRFSSLPHLFPPFFRTFLKLPLEDTFLLHPPFPSPRSLQFEQAKRFIGSRHAHDFTYNFRLVPGEPRYPDRGDESSRTPTRRAQSSPLRDTDISSAQSSHISISSLSSGRLVRVTSKELPSSPYNIPMYPTPPPPGCTPLPRPFSSSWCFDDFLAGHRGSMKCTWIDISSSTRANDCVPL